MPSLGHDHSRSRAPLGQTAEVESESLGKSGKVDRDGDEAEDPTRTRTATGEDVPGREP